MSDPDLTAVWREWWDALPYVADEVSDQVADSDLASLEALLAEHGFAIVRRLKHG